MSLNHLRVLVLDLELQCWPEDVRHDGLSNDIIQIGIVELDMSALVQTRETSLYIRPERYEISPYCTALTGITPEVVRKQGRRFREALNSITKEFGPDNKMCLAWGDDNHAIENACREAEIYNPFHCLDLGWLYSSSQGVKRNLSVEDALLGYGLTFEGRAHDALVDARNTGRLYLEMIARLRRYQTLVDVYKDTNTNWNSKDLHP